MTKNDDNTFIFGPEDPSVLIPQLGVPWNWPGEALAHPAPSAALSPAKAGRRGHPLRQQDKGFGF